MWTLVRMRQLGIPDAEILLSYSSLKTVDLAHAWTYAGDHREEIEQAIRENEE